MFVITASLNAFDGMILFSRKEQETIHNKGMLARFTSTVWIHGVMAGGAARSDIYHRVFVGYYHWGRKARHFRSIHTGCLIGIVAQIPHYSIQSGHDVKSKKKCSDLNSCGRLRYVSNKSSNGPTTDILICKKESFVPKNRSMFSRIFLKYQK